LRGDVVASARQLLKDPEFHKLPIDDKLGLLREDPEFMALSLKDQGFLLSDFDSEMRPMPKIEAPPQSPQKGMGQQVQEFGKTLFDGAMGTGKAIFDVMNPHNAIQMGVKAGMDPGKFVNETLAPYKQIHDEAGAEASQGNTMGAVGKRIAGSIPVIGPLINSSGEAIGRGDYGEGAAHGLMAIAGGKSMTPAKGPNVIPRPVQRASAGVRGAAKAVGKEAMNSEATQGMSVFGGSIPEQLSGAAGYAVGHSIGGYPGGIAGYTIGKHVPRLAKTAAPGFRQGVQAFDRANPKGTTRPPIWEGAEPSVPQVPEFQPVVPEALPSGRVPGGPEFADQLASSRLVQRDMRQSGWQQEGTQPSIPQVPEAAPIPGQLPSGRVPGGPDVAAALEAEQVSKLPREVIWQGRTAPSTPQVTEATPILGELKSGRKVPTAEERAARAERKVESPKEAKSDKPTREVKRGGDAEAMLQALKEGQTKKISLKAPETTKKKKSKSGASGS
jgi:hypothetical protein